MLSWKVNAFINYLIFNFIEAAICRYKTLKKYYLVDHPL
jgi:hypothetical protein